MIAPSEARRIEAGIFNYGSDIRIEDTPLHVTGLEKYVEWDAGAGLPRAATARGDPRRRTCVDRKLVGIDIGGDPMTDEGALNDFWPLVPGRRRARPGHGRRVVAAAGAEHRLRVGADPMGGAGLASSRPMTPRGRVP